MPITHHPLTEAHKREICSWKYQGEYAVYNLPPFETLKEQQSGFMNPEREKDYIGFSVNNTLVGYVNLREKPDGIFVGIGVHPDYCNQGLGRQILRMVADLCPDHQLFLIVRTWNQRAIECYRHAGFQIEGEPFEYPERGIFCRMTRT